jgi:hypothetical protein
MKKIEIICDKCGKILKPNELGMMPDFFSVEKQWTYPSKYDGEIHCFDLCEECYSELFSVIINKASRN